MAIQMGETCRTGQEVISFVSFLRPELSLRTSPLITTSTPGSHGNVKQRPCRVESFIAQWTKSVPLREIHLTK